MKKIIIIVFILFSSIYSQNNLFKSHPYGTLGTAESLTASTSIGDVDGDKDLDIIVANGRHWAEQNQIFFNDGKGFFRRSRSLGAEANTTYQIPMTDIDNDGDLDLIVANDRTENQIYKNDGNGNFVFDHYFGKKESNTRGLCIIDLNKDGYDDIVVANRKSQNYIYYNNSKGNFSKGQPFGNHDEATIKIASADLNQDGYLDLVLANRNNQHNRIY